MVEELRGEKVDIIKWSDDPGQYVAAALARPCHGGPGRLASLRCKLPCAAILRAPRFLLGGLGGAGPLAVGEQPVADACKARRAFLVVTAAGGRAPPGSAPAWASSPGSRGIGAWVFFWARRVLAGALAEKLIRADEGLRPTLEPLLHEKKNGRGQDLGGRHRLLGMLGQNRGNSFGLHTKILRHVPGVQFRKAQTGHLLSFRHSGPLSPPILLKKSRAIERALSAPTPPEVWDALEAQMKAGDGGD